MKFDLKYVPKGWKKTNIADKLFFQEGPGVRKWQFKNEGIKLLNVGNINGGKIDLDKTDKHLSIEEATKKYSHFLVDEGDLLIACSGILVNNFYNKIAFAKKEHLPLCLNTSTMRFKPLNDDLDLNYFKYYLQTVHFTSQLQKLITGSAQLNFGPSHIRKIDFLYPPLSTQKRIAEILDNAAALRDKTKQLLTKYDQLAQSIFLDMFGDPVMNPKEWEKVKLKSIASVSSGSTPSRKIDKYWGGKIPWVKTGEVKSKLILDTEEKITQDGLLNSSCKLYEKGSIIIAMYGQGKTRGQVGLLGIDATTNQACAVLQPSSKMNSTFLYEFLKMSYDTLRNLGRGGNQPNLNSGLIKNFQTINPPINLQNQFAEKIALIEQQKDLAKQELQESEDLFQALLQKAFKGELVD
ncbi:restriction endonuclease subunit S [uncultured Mesonia sp.]|uniref:restriction endonuclease subunit S n=1 Tax=uncultured Mesonia sp. TaxID=399731 RepID=UPI00374E72A8